MTASKSSSSRGQGLVEFAVVLPVVFLLALGLFDAGRLVIDYATLANASRVGARVAMVNQSNDTSCASVLTFKCAASDHSGAMVIPPDSISDVEVSLDGAAIDLSDCALRGDCDVTVTLEHDFSMITPLIGSIIGPLSLTSSTTMPMERAFANP